MTNGPPLRAARLAASLAFGCSVAATACSPSVELGALDTWDGGLVSCGAPAGPVEALSSVPEAFAAIEGDWQLCSPTFLAAPADAIGMEFGPVSSAPPGNGSLPGGLAYYLVQGPKGPVPGQGFAYQLTYDVWFDGTTWQLDIHPTPSSGFGGPWVYSSSPRQVQVGQQPGTVILAAF